MLIELFNIATKNLIHPKSNYLKQLLNKGSEKKLYEINYVFHKVTQKQTKFDIKRKIYMYFFRRLVGQLSY